MVSIDVRILTLYCTMKILNVVKYNQKLLGIHRRISNLLLLVIFAETKTIGDWIWYYILISNYAYGKCKVDLLSQTKFCLNSRLKATIDSQLSGLETNTHRQNARFCSKYLKRLKEIWLSC